MVKKSILFLFLFSGAQIWAMEPQPEQPQRQVPTLQAFCGKAVLKNSDTVQALSMLAKRNLVHQFLSNFCAQPSACILGDSNSVNYLGGYRFLTPGAIRDTVLNKTCMLTQREPVLLNNNIVHNNGTLVEHNGDSITLHVWDPNGTSGRAYIPAHNLIDSYANCCFITTDADDQICTFWYKNQENVCEKIGILIHWYDCIECAKVFFLVQDGTLRVFDKKLCTLQVVQLQKDDVFPVNFCHYDKKISVNMTENAAQNGVLSILNSDTLALEAEYPYDFEHGCCDIIVPGELVQCKCFDGTAQFYDLKHKKDLATFKAPCMYEYVRAQRNPFIVVIPTLEEECVQLWDITTKECVYTFDSAWRYQNVCHDNVIFSRDNQLIAWNVIKQEVVLVLSEQAHDQEHPIKMVAYDTYLIVGDAQHLKIWDMALQKCVHTMRAGNFDIYTHNHILEVNHDDGTCSTFALHLLEPLERELDSLSDEQIDYIVALLFTLEAMLDTTLSGDCIKLFAQEQYKKLPELVQHLIFSYFEREAAHKNLEVVLIPNQTAVYCLSPKQ